MRIFSDPHLGLDRKAHTTSQSRGRLSEAILNSVRAICHSRGPGIVCAGDLFDAFSNSEETIIEAAYAVANCDVVLAGNHDSLNQRDVKGSLNVIDSLLKHTSVIQCPDFDKPFFEQGEIEDMSLIFIPHHATQDLFDQAVEKFCASFDQSKSMHRAVFLHCNYENPMTLGSDISLNLTKAQAQKLLRYCDYIFMGHEHQPRELLAGRLIIVGSPHPTSFADISDKYYYELSEKGLEKHKCWSKETGHAQIQYDGGEFPKIPKAQFIDIQGQITSEQGADLAEYISHCWKESGAFMVRNSVSIVADDNQVFEAIDFHTLPDEITKQLAGTELEEKWSHYRGLVKC